MKSLASVLVLAYVTVTISAQQPPCPPPIPELADVVNTVEKCMCFYALIGSGLELGDSSTYDTVFDSDSVQYMPQVGQYGGVDGIKEYLTWVKAGESGFIKDYTLVGQPLFLDIKTGLAANQCIATTSERRRFSFNSFYTKKNTEICANVAIGQVLYYTMTGKPEAPITIQTLKSYLPNELFSTALPFTTDTQATAEFICDAIVNTCGYDRPKRRLKSGKTKSPKSPKSPKQSNPMKKCLKKLNKLPLVDDGELSYFDGNTIGCRMIHAYYSKTNPEHCPHISFEADKDANGLIKCNKSKQTALTDLFTKKHLKMFKRAGKQLGLGKAGFDIKFDACPGA